MKKLVFACLLGVVAACIHGGCGKAKPSLQVCGPSNSIKPELIDRFSKENNCAVIYNSVESDEAAIVALKEGGQDIAIVSDQSVPRLREEGVLLAFDRPQMPNLKNLDPIYLRYAADHEAKMSVPLSVRFLGIAYNNGAFDGTFESSWNALDRTESGTVVLLSDNMRATLGIALRALGFSANTADPRELSAAEALVREGVRKGAHIESGTLGSRLAKGSPLAAMASSSEYLDSHEKRTDVTFAVPWEGTLLFFSELVISREAEYPVLAQSFINFLHDPEVAAENAQYARVLCPNKASYRHLPREMQANPAILLPAKILTKSETLQPLGDAEQDYLAAWDEIKASQ